MTADSKEPTADAKASNRDAVFADLDFTTDRLSTQVRQLSLSMLAICWALLVQSDGATKLALNTSQILIIAALATVTMMIDFLQYVAAYYASRGALADLKEGGRGKYRSESLSYRMRRWCFSAKLVLVGVTVSVFLFFIVRVILRNSASV